MRVCAFLCALSRLVRDKCVFSASLRLEKPSTKAIPAMSMLD